VDLQLNRAAPFEVRYHNDIAFKDPKNMMRPMSQENSTENDADDSAEPSD
jgi:hypothetical protein